MCEKSFRSDDFVNDLLQKYSKMVYRIAYARTKNASDADDIMQEVFLRFVRANISSLDDEEHRKAWLIKATINRSSSLLSSAWFRRTTALDETIPAKTEETGDVLSAVLELPKKYRTVIHLFYYEDLSVLQISETLGAKESTVKSWLLRARKMLKEKLEGEYGYV